VELGVPVGREFLAASSAVIMCALRGLGSVHLSLLKVGLENRSEDIDEVADIIGSKSVAIEKKLKKLMGRW
jgi:hypothetical protein